MPPRNKYPFVTTYNNNFLFFLKKQFPQPLHKGKEKSRNVVFTLKQEEKAHTVFQPSGSVHAVILVLMPGNGPGSRVIFPPFTLIASAVL
jgi:dTDP-4-amino-4,6-dideoxygalactose transaminase